MRDSLTVLAILLIGVLTAALVGPYLVDWSSHRALVEHRLSEGLGTPVTVAGDIDLKILPTPRFRFGRVAIGDARGGRPRLSAEALEAELSFTSLLRGQVQVVDTTWVRPRLDLTQAPDGSVDLALPEGRGADRVAVDHLGVRDGTIALALADGRHDTLAGLDVDGQAASLKGPFKATGTWGGVPFRLATGTFDRGSLRVKLHLDADSLRPSLDVDGTAATARAAAGGSGPAFDGSATATGAVTLDGTAATIPWTLTGHLAATRDVATASEVELRAGTEARALIANGDGKARYGARDGPPSASLTLHGPALDLDRLAVMPEGGSVAPPSGTDLVAEWLRRAGEGTLAPSLPLRLALSAGFDTATLGGQTLLGTRATLTLGPSSAAGLALAVEGPQGARLTLDGALDPGPSRPVAGPFGAVPAPSDAVFRGHAEVRANDVGRTAAWLNRLAPGVATALAAAPGRALAAEGAIEASRTGIVARNLRLDLDGSAFTGLVSLTRAVGAERGRLFADLSSDALALDRVPDLTAAAAAARDLDLDLALAARAVTVTDASAVPGAGPAGPLAAGHVALHLVRTGDELKLDRLSLDLDGAALAGSASRSGSAARADLRISAPHLGPLVARFGGWLPPEAATLLRARAGALSPVDASLGVEASTSEADGTSVPHRFTLRGTAGGTRLDVALAPEGDPGRVALTLRADNAEASDLLRQAGVAVPAGSLGPAHLEARGSGTAASGFEGQADGTLGTARLAFAGRGLPSRGSGRLTLETADLGPLLAGLGVPGSGTDVPADAAADIGWDTTRIDARGLTARVAGTTATGDLTWDLQPAPAAAGAPPGPVLRGAVTLDRLPSASLTALAFGPAPAPAPKLPWSTAPFAPPAWSLPRAAVSLRIGAMPVAAGLEARGVALALATQPGAVTLSRIAGTLAGGTVGGTLTARRDAGGDTLSGQVAWTDVGVDAAGLSGRTSGRQDFAATGQSPAALVVSLAGTGMLALRDASLAATDPAAPGRIAAAIAARDAKAENAAGGSDTTPTDAEAIRRALLPELAAAPLRLGEATSPMTLAGGVLRIGPLKPAAPAAGEAAPWSANATLDLSTLTLTTRAGLRGVGGGDVTVTRSGPLGGALVTAVDTTALVGAVQAQAIARAQERIDILEQDIRERAAFNRQLKAIQADQQAARERADADRKAAAEARRADDARRKADEARVQAQFEAAARADAERQRAERAAKPADAAQDPAPDR